MAGTTAPIKVTDNAGNLIGKIRQMRRSGRRVWEAMAKNDEGRYVLVGHVDSRSEAQDAVSAAVRFGWI